MAVTKHSIEHVVEDQLCHRCGACLPVCPIHNCITFGEDLYPRVNADTCIECGHCEKVCSGDKLDLDALKATLVTPPQPYASLGGFHQPYVAYATDAQTRLRGASGGFVTQLLVHLLERGEIDGAIVAGMDPSQPWSAHPVIARTPEQIREAAQSKYTPVPMVAALQEIMGRGEERYAFVGVSCHLHSLHMMMQARPRVLRNKIRYTIGLFCNGVFEPAVVTDLLKQARIPADDVEALEYRGGTWPGLIRIRTKSGEHRALHYSNVKDGALNYLTSLYTQPRCWLCFDWMNELCDLGAGDPWGRSDDGRYPHTKGETLIVPRTAAGLELIQMIHRDPGFELEPVDEDYVKRCYERTARSKAKAVRVQIEGLKTKGKPYPRYARELPDSCWKHRLRQRLFSLSIALGKNPKIRYIALKLLLSRPARFLVYLRQVKKYGWRNFRYMHNLTPRPDSGVPSLVKRFPARGPAQGAAPAGETACGTH